MVRRCLALLVLIWLLGLVWFVVSLPGAAADEATDGIVVLTGGKGRIERGTLLIKTGLARRMLVSGVDPLVKPGELAAAYKMPGQLVACCVDLGKQAFDTRTNAEETARWVKRHKFRSIRLVTTDWHMPRARFDLERQLDDEVTVLPDAVESAPSLGVLLREYHKLIARYAAALLGL